MGNRHPREMIATPRLARGMAYRIRLTTPSDLQLCPTRVPGRTCAAGTRTRVSIVMKPIDGPVQFLREIGPLPSRFIAPLPLAEGMRRATIWSGLVWIG